MVRKAGAFVERQVNRYVDMMRWSSCSCWPGLEDSSSMRLSLLKKKKKKKKKKLSSVSVVLVEFCSVFGRVFSWKRLRHLDV